MNVSDLMSFLIFIAVCYIFIIISIKKQKNEFRGEQYFKVTQTLKLDGIPLADIIKVVTQNRKVKKLILFGSRARKDSKAASDIDLAVSGAGLSDTDINLIRNNLEEEVKTPLKFDVVHLETLSKTNLKKEILEEGIILYESKKN